MESTTKFLTNIERELSQLEDNRKEIKNSKQAKIEQSTRLLNKIKAIEVNCQEIFNEIGKNEKDLVLINKKERELNKLQSKVIQKNNVLMEQLDIIRKEVRNKNRLLKHVDQSITELKKQNKDNDLNIESESSQLKKITNSIVAKKSELENLDKKKILQDKALEQTISALQLKNAEFKELNENLKNKQLHIEKLEKLIDQKKEETIIAQDKIKDLEDNVSIKKDKLIKTRKLYLIEEKRHNNFKSNEDKLNIELDKFSNAYVKSKTSLKMKIDECKSTSKRIEQLWLNKLEVERKIQTNQSLINSKKVDFDKAQKEAINLTKDERSLRLKVEDQRSKIEHLDIISKKTQNKIANTRNQISKNQETLLIQELGLKGARLRVSKHTQEAARMNEKKSEQEIKLNENKNKLFKLNLDH